MELGQVFADGKRKAGSTAWKVGEPHYDVRQTGSPASPYAGSVSFPASRRSRDGEVRTLVRVEYVFQGGRWVPTKAEFKAADAPDAAWREVTGGADRPARELAKCFTP